MFYLAGVGLCFFLCVLLFTKRKKTTADKILSYWLLTMTLHLLLFYFRAEGLYPELLGADFAIPLMHGPFLYLYARALTNKVVPARFAALHFIPAATVVFQLIPFFQMSTEEKLAIFRNNGAGYEVFNMVRLVAVIASGFVYVILSSLVLQKHRRTIVQEYSSTEKINLQWLQYLIYWILVLWIIVVFRDDEWIFAAAVLFVAFVGYFGIRQIGIFTHHESTLSPSKPPQPPETTGIPKYQKSGLSEDAAQKLHAELQQLMIRELVFRESELSLSDLARRLNTQPNYLSQVINEREGKNFYDYINTLRITEFMRLASNPGNRKYTLLGLAQDCGFSSKSSFHRYFKKVTGQSPSEFLQIDKARQN